MAEKEVIFFTGGARSGKSAAAQLEAEGLEGQLVYLATAEVRDDEMADRVKKHQLVRGARWSTLEEPLDLAGALRSIGEDKGGVLVDCLTLWTSNLLERHHGDVDSILAMVDEFISELQKRRLNVVVVTNETGSGIVPIEPLARSFRDLAGTINQRVAAVADRAYLVVSGLPLRLGKS
ncbi:MAG: bifunctional adenosylcobinamide kinase/adenosylcobinamide-phosphate guanylyltransferase [Deltaproteobacteria bacterium]|nr:MAG: bifunctional adenosylcobinamide kinase/adenosylcobinamide-phosphate guanylyltransferase [Deltaproteobacteria bacterium]